MASPFPTAPAATIDPRVRIRIVIAVMLGLFLAALDQTIVGTALPRIVTELRGNDIYTWAFTAYLLTATISGPIYGKLSDLFGRRPVLLFAVSVFLVGSALSGLSREMWQLVAFRGLQGLGAGALFPVALAVIGDLFDAAERGKYQGFVGAVFGLSSLVGPAIGGIITDTVGWQWVFFVNLPIGAVVFAVIWRSLPRIRPSGARPRVDYRGASLLVAALVPILIGLTNKQSADWSDPSVGGLIAAGLAISAIFVWVEARTSEPIVPVDLFRDRAFTISVIAMFMASAAFFAPIVFLPRWFQVVGGASATQSGYQILALLAPQRIGTATSSLTLFQQIGGSVGLAFAGTVFASRMAEELPRQLAGIGLPRQLVETFGASGGATSRLVGTGDLGQAILAGAPAGAREQLAPFVPDIVAAVHRAFSLATASTFVFGIGAAVIAAVMVAFLRERPMRAPAALPSEEPEADSRPRLVTSPGE
ncbi:MAG: MFS transporter [Chloroflexi bacterium]|nr:MAG: MFS transporter [Chloroflexota bacterium]